MASILNALTRKRSPEQLVRQTLSDLESLQSVEDEEERNSICQDITEKLQNVKDILYGDGERDPDPNRVVQMRNELMEGCLITPLLSSIEKLPFEARKTTTLIFSNLLRNDGDNSFQDYLSLNFHLVEEFVGGYENEEIGIHTGNMLRECIKVRILCVQILEMDSVWRLFSEYPQLPNFDVSTDAFNTLRDLLLRHKEEVQSFLDVHYDEFVHHFSRLLDSDNYVTKRQSLRLLGEVLLERTNFEIMMRYIASKDNLKTIMGLLRASSQSIQYEAFQLFKVFVANPNKNNDILKILYWNGDKLVAFLQKFQNEKDDEDSQFQGEKEVIISTLKEIKLHCQDNEEIPDPPLR